MLYLQCQAQGVYSTTVLFRDLEPRYPHSVAALLLFHAFPRTRKVRSFTVEQSVHDVAVNLLGDFCCFRFEDGGFCKGALGLVGWIRRWLSGVRPVHSDVCQARSASGRSQIQKIESIQLRCLGQGQIHSREGAIAFTRESISQAPGCCALCFGSQT